MSVTLSDEQQNAYNAIIAFAKGAPKSDAVIQGDGEASYRYEDQGDGYRQLVITGYAGTGKTQLMAQVADELSGHVLLAAPTHKAKKVLNAKLGTNIVRTVHSLLYISPSDRREVVLRLLEGGDGSMDEKAREALVAELKALRAMGGSMSFGPRLNWDESSKLIMIDEASMVSSEMTSIAKTLGLSVIYFGDGGQLPPVKQAVGVDLNSPDYALSRIFRNAEDSPIPHVALEIRNSELRDLPSIIERAKANHPDVFLSHPSPDGMNITWTNKARQQLNEKMSPVGHDLVEGQDYIVHNSGPNSGLTTSDMVHIHKIVKSGVGGNPFLFDVVLQIEGTDSKMHRTVSTTDLDNRARVTSFAVKAAKADQTVQLALPYAITCHKSQGSEYPVVNVFGNGHIAFRKASMEQRRSWYYTALTRAREKVYIEL